MYEYCSAGSLVIGVGLIVWSLWGFRTAGSYAAF